MRAKDHMRIKLYHFMTFHLKIQVLSQKGKHHIRSSIKMCIQMYPL